MMAMPICIVDQRIVLEVSTVVYEISDLARELIYQGELTVCDNIRRLPNMCYSDNAHHADAGFLSLAAISNKPWW